MSDFIAKEISCSQGDFKIGRFTLNSESTLNSLTFSMLDNLQEHLLKWNKDTKIAAIFIEGAGSKAFCAGGNIKALHKGILDAKGKVDESSFPYKFFLKEYSTDYIIHRIKKPIVAWMHGFTMGGGLGLINGAKFRVATPQTLVSMPEISIGLYPDVGAFYFLNRLKIAGLGLFMALTGARLKGYDTVRAGLADFYFDNDSREEIIKTFQNTAWTEIESQNQDLAKNSLQKIKESKDPQTSQISGNCVEKLENWDRIEDIDDLISDFYKNKSSMSDWQLQGLDFFKKGSPTSARVIFKRFKSSKQDNLFDTFRKDVNMSIQFALGTDFLEGIRALVIDKDQEPKWNPPSLKQVCSEIVETHFENPFKDKNIDPLFEYLKNIEVANPGI